MLIPSCVLAALALLNETKEIAPGVYMHRISMGTCCGSDTTGVPGWIAAGGRGFDTAYDYGKQVSGGQQSDLAKAIANFAASTLSRKKRELEMQLTALLSAPTTIGFGVLVAILLAAGIGVSALGSAISMRRFLQV